MKIFISYAHQDNQLVERVRAVCKEEGLDVQLDRDTRANQSDKTMNKLTERIRDSPYFLCIVTPASMRSYWVALEIGFAAQLEEPGKDKRIIPYVADKRVNLPLFMKEYDPVSSLEELRQRIRFTKSRHDVAHRLSELQKQVPKTIEWIDQLRANTPEAELAVAKSLDEILRQHYVNMSRLVADGVITAFGPALYEMYGHFMTAVSSSFRAVTAKDLDYWVQAESRQYLDQNAKLIARGRAAERVFMLEAIDQDPLRAALKPHFDREIGVRIAFFDKCNDLAPNNKISDLDFGLFDDFAVSFFRTGHGRGYAITTNPDVCKEYTTTFDLIVNKCEIVPGKKGGDKKLFQSDEEFNRWIQASNPREGRA